MSMQKGVQTVIMFGVLVVVLVVLGILGTSLRNSQATTDPAYGIANDSVTGIVNTAQQMKVSGTIVGIFILVIIAVAMLALLVSLIKKFGGSKGGGA